MLTDSQRQVFLDLLDRTSRLYGQPPLPVGVKQLWWELLAPRFALEELKRALERHLCDPDRGKRFPYPADLIAAAEADQEGVPSADEAWSIALASFDEARTVCTTAEILEARNLATPIYSAGDLVGARMAFRAAYERLRRRRREEGAAVCWTMSLGWDPEGRFSAIQEARMARRLSQVPRTMTDGFPTKPAPDAQVTRGVLSSAASSRSAKARTQQRLSALRDIVCRAERRVDPPLLSASSGDQVWQQAVQLALDAVSSTDCSEPSKATDEPEGLVEGRARWTTTPRPEG